MVIKYLYNSYNLAKTISSSAADHVLFFNKELEELPNYNDPKVKKDKVNFIWNQNRWYMIGLFEASDRMLYQSLNKALEEDKKRVDILLKNEKEE